MTQTSEISETSEDFEQAMANRKSPAMMKTAKEAPKPNADTMTAEDRSIVVIGAGQAGLATGYFLQTFGLEFIILADDERVGDSWRERWDSLRLFTPAFYNHLPGMPFPADDPEYLPAKDEVADYLEAYAEVFDLPVQLDTRVTRIQQDEETFVLTTDAGPIRAAHVVVATGAYRSPYLPPVADQIPEHVLTCHSCEYANPAQLQAGDVLVAGAGNSGTQIATEIATDDESRQVWLVGPDRGQLPRRLLGLDLYRWIGPTLLKLSRTSFLGRRLYEKVSDQGDPVFENEHAKMQDAGVERVAGRITAVKDGRPATDEGDRFDVNNVVWCTGFSPEFSWIDVDVFQEDGSPRHERGVVPEAPGLYFVGLPWLDRLNSSLIGGVGTDAEHIATHIKDHVHDED